MSILSMLTSYITPSTIGQIAGMLGINQNTVEKAMTGAIPGLLASLLGAGSKPGGRDALDRALSGHDGGLLDDIGTILGQRGETVAKEGGDLMSSILGGGQFDSLVSALAGPTGLAKGQAGSLAGLAGSLVMGALGKQAKASNVGAAGLLDMLQSEKHEIAKAMPNEFAQAFRGTGLIDSISDQLGAAGAAAAGAGAAASRTASAATATAASAANKVKSGTPWWYWLVGLIALLVLLWLVSSLFFGGNTAEQALEEAAEATSALVVGGTDLGAEIGGAIQSLGGSLSSITDVDSATAALPDLQAVRDSLQGLSGSVSDLSAEGRTALRSLVEEPLAQIEGTANSLVGDAGIADAIGPLLTEIIDLIKGFVGA